VTEGVTGFIHPPGDAARLADDVERMESLGAAGRATMGRAGREWLLANASPEQWLAGFSNILHSVAKR
jgi:hypothetical protein